MDADLILIFSFVITIVLLGVITAQVIHRRTVAHEERKLELQARIEEAKAQQVRTETDLERKLEDRVRVLERIATDRGADLAAQIDDLRDRQPLLREPAQ